MTIPVIGRVYVSAVFALGIGVIGHSAYTLAVTPIGYEWLSLAALTLVSGSATVRLTSVPATISISETFVFTSILLFGPAAGTLTVALDSLVISFWLVRRHPEPIRVLFNLAAPALSLWIAANLFYLTAGISQCWQAELRPFGIRVMCVCPSEVQTNWGGRTGRNNPNKLYAD